jgi:hypothetical protein
MHWRKIRNCTHPIFGRFALFEVKFTTSSSEMCVLNLFRREVPGRRNPSSNSKESKREGYGDDIFVAI